MEPIHPVLIARVQFFPVPCLQYTDKVPSMLVSTGVNVMLNQHSYDANSSETSNVTCILKQRGKIQRIYTTVK